MAENLFAKASGKALRSRLEPIIAKDLRPLPPKAKTFAAVAKIQEFDSPPELADHSAFQRDVDGGWLLELNRGLFGGQGIPAAVYAMALAFGPLHPGTQSAYGHGIYFATPSKEVHIPFPGFSKISKIAEEYAHKGDSGIILRAGLKKGAKTISMEDLLTEQRNWRNKTVDARILDIGTFAAAYGFDAYYTDRFYTAVDERVWIVVNRGALIVQKNGLRIAKQQIR